MSDYHPAEWNPAWSVSTILTGLLSFMLESTATTGSIETSLEEKRLLARNSKEFNRNSKTFRGISKQVDVSHIKDVFPELCVDPLPSSSVAESLSQPLSSPPLRTKESHSFFELCMRHKSAILRFILLMLILYLFLQKIASRL